MKCFAVLAVLLALVSGAAAQSIHTLPQGTKLSGTVDFGLFRLPLPPGEWTLIGAARQVAPSLNGGMSPPTGTAFLALIESGSLVAVVEATGSIDPQHVEWSPDPECRRDDFWLTEADRNFRNADQTCRLVSHATRGWTAGTDWPTYQKQAMQWLQENKIRRPQQMLLAKFRRASFGDFLSVSYSVNPEHFGQARSASAAWASSDWHKVNYPGQPARKAFAEAWLRWSEAMAPVFIEGFKKNAGTAAPAFPFTSVAKRVPAATAIHGSYKPPAVGTRIVTSRGYFQITKVDGMAVTTVNAANSTTVWHVGGLMWMGSQPRFDANVAGDLFPLAVGKKVAFEQYPASGNDGWRRSAEIVRRETLTVGGRDYDTFVIEALAETLKPEQGNAVIRRTLWYSPEIGWLLRLRGEQLSGPPQQINSWDATDVVLPN